MGDMGVGCALVIPAPLPMPDSGRGTTRRPPRGAFALWWKERESNMTRAGAIENHGCMMSLGAATGRSECSLREETNVCKRAHLSLGTTYPRLEHENNSVPTCQQHGQVGI